MKGEVIEVLGVTNQGANNLTYLRRGNVINLNLLSLSGLIEEQNTEAELL